MNRALKFQHLLILGGAGRVGQSLVQQALARGYRVTAMVRDPSKLDLTESDSLTLLCGDVRNSEQLEAALGNGIDAVLSTLGIFQREPGTPLADLTGPLLESIERWGISRFVCMSSLGVGDTRELGNLIVKYVTRVTLRYVLIDKAKQEQLVETSELDWTILRPPRILDSSEQRECLRWRQLPIGGKPRWKISKYDAAAEMLTLLQDDSSIGQTWQISY